MIRIPPKIKVGALVYDVTVTDNISLGIDYTGEICYRTLGINLRPLVISRMERAFIHEALHAIYDNLGYTNQDENKIEELTGALHSFIVDNPAIFEKRDEEERNNEHNQQVTDVRCV